MKVRLRPLQGFVVALVVIGLAGCGSSGTSGNSQSKSSTGMKTIGLVQIDLSNPFHVGEVEGAKAAAAAHNFKLEVRSGDGDVQKQVRAFEGLVTEKVDAIAVNAIDINAFGPALAKAKEAGIPVVSLHSQTPLAQTMLGFSERATGKAVGDYAIGLLKARYGEPKGEVAILQGLLGQGLNTDRTGGFVDAVKNYPNVKIVAEEPTDWNPQKASSVTENLLTAYPHLDMIYGLSDSLTIPASIVIKRKGMEKQVLVVSVDGTKEGLDAVKNGTLASTFLYDPQYAGYWKAWVPWKLAEGQTVPKEIDMSGVLVTTDNVGDVDKLVTAASTNMKDFPFEKTLPEIYKQYVSGN